MTGYGPLLATTPGARCRAARRAGSALAVIVPVAEMFGDRLATASGPAVAARVVL